MGDELSLVMRQKNHSVATMPENKPSYLWDWMVVSFSPNIIRSSTHNLCIQVDVKSWKQDPGQSSEHRGTL